jgi:hypothetical protein
MRKTRVGKEKGDKRKVESGKSKESDSEETPDPTRYSASKQVRPAHRKCIKASTSVPSQGNITAKEKGHCVTGGQNNIRNSASANRNKDEVSKCVTASSSISSKELLLSLEAPASIEAIVNKNSDLYRVHLEQLGYHQSQSDMKANLKWFVTTTLFS